MRGSQVCQVDELSGRGLSRFSKVKGPSAQCLSNRGVRGALRSRALELRALGRLSSRGLSSRGLLRTISPTFGFSWRGILNSVFPRGSSADGAPKLRLLESRALSSRLPSRVEHVFEGWFSSRGDPNWFLKSIGSPRQGLLRGSLFEGISSRGLPSRGFSSQWAPESRDIEPRLFDGSRDEVSETKEVSRQKPLSQVLSRDHAVDGLESRPGRSRLANPSRALDSRAFD